MFNKTLALKIVVPAMLGTLRMSALADEVLFAYECNELPTSLPDDWTLGHQCESICIESIQNGHFVIEWPEIQKTVFYDHTIANAFTPPPPPTLWVEWRFRSNHPVGPIFTGTDGSFTVDYGCTHQSVDIYGDGATTGAGDYVGGLELDAFHDYRYESIDGLNFTISVDGEVFINRLDTECNNVHYLQFYGNGNDLQFPGLHIVNMWDHIRYGSISFGEQIVATDPPAGLLDATPYAGLTHFTVTFDSPNYVYADEITVGVTGGVTPAVIQTRRLDNGQPEEVEIVLNGRMPLNETTTFTFDDGVAVNVVEYTVVPIGACCFADGSCEVLVDSDCASAGGAFIDGPCGGDIDGDGIDGRCGDPCPFDNPDDTDGDGVCDSNDPCPIDNPDDSDGDGVCNSVDNCPGFDDALDSDGDTVPDCLDQCPGADDAQYAPECGTAIPTTTAWGVVILTLLFVAAAKAIWVGRRNKRRLISRI